MLVRRQPAGHGRWGWCVLVGLCGSSLLVGGCSSRGPLGRVGFDKQSGPGIAVCQPTMISGSMPTNACGAEACAATSALSPRLAWPRIPYDQRGASQLAVMAEPILGRVVTETPPTQVRSLTRENVQSLAAAAAPVAGQLRQHGQWLQANGQETLGQAVLAQAQYEATQHQQLAEEAWLNLARVHCQSTVADHGLDYLHELESALQQFRQAGVNTPVRPDELPRQRAVVQESIVELEFNQARLTAALESLLQLDDNGPPIWAVATSSHVDIPGNPDQALVVAWERRADLRAWRQLAAQPESVPNEAWGALHPWLATGLPKLPPSWWWCLLKREVKEREASERRQRADLLHAAVAAQEEKLRVEIRGHYHSLQRIGAQLDLKLQQRDLLREARAQVAAVEMDQPDVRRGLEDTQTELRLTAEIIDLMFDQEIKLMKLSYTIGGQ